MYNYAASVGLDLPIDGVTSIYLLGTATALLAVLIALYCANVLKQENAEDCGPERSNLEHLDDECSADKIDHEQQLGVQKNLSDIDDDNENDGSDTKFHCDGLVGKLKSARLRKLETQLTKQQLEDERRIEREQLAAIIELLKKQETELNTEEFDESELNEQLHLYR